MRKLVIGDIQGNFKGLMQCLERSGFDYEKDELIILGDVCDGLTQTRECFDELLKVKNLILILGNHDEWLLDWIQGNHPGDVWTTQGGRNTQVSYGNSPSNVPLEHQRLLENANLIFEDEDGRVFVHGGLDPTKTVEQQHRNVMLWDRDLVRVARTKHNQKPDFKYGGFKEIFVGHTTTEFFGGTTKPLNFCNVWMLDTGGGWSGRITIMDVETKEYWQSDPTPELYPGVMPRG